MENTVNYLNTVTGGKKIPYHYSIYLIYVSKEKKHEESWTDKNSVMSYNNDITLIKWDFKNDHYQA